VGSKDAKAIKIRCNRSKKGVGSLAELDFDHEEALQLVSEICKELDRRKRSPRDLFATENRTNRMEHSRMLDRAVDLLGRRTGAGAYPIPHHKHSKSLEFIDRHPRLLMCVNLLFHLNRERVIT